MGRLKVVAIEEHFWSPSLRDSYPENQVAFVRALTGENKLDDVAERRLADLDRAGIDVQVLSQWQPGAQDASPAASIRLAMESNDFLAERIARHPTRFRGFATLPTPDPRAAAKELERCIAQLGFVGALVNGHTLGTYLDEPQFRPLLETAAGLDVPIYLHPRTPHPDVMKAYFRDNFALSQAAWGYAVETATHALKLIVGGVFDEIPGLRIILGHLGECIPYYLWRFDHSIVSHANMPGAGKRLKKRPRETFLDHFTITTSGNFDPIALRCAISVMGAERIMFATDYPVESLAMAMEFLDGDHINTDERRLIAHANAERVLRIQ